MLLLLRRRVMRKKAFLFILLLIPALSLADTTERFDPATVAQTQAQFQALLSQQDQAEPVKLLYTPQRPIIATLNSSFVFSHPNDPVTITLYSPNPPMMKRQTIESATTLATEPASLPGYPITQYDPSPMHKPSIETQLETTDGTFDATTTMHLSLMRIQLAPLSPGETPAVIPPLPPNVRAYATDPTAYYDFNTPAFKDWLDQNNLHPQPGESTIRFAQRVYIFIENHFTYYYAPNLDRTATNTIVTGKTDCGGFSILFNSVMRYHGIPAFALIGRWAISGGVNPADTEQTHVKQEFYVANVGWVPVDVTGGVQYKKNPTDLSYFGNDSGKFIVFAIDPGITLNFWGENITFFNFQGDIEQTKPQNINLTRVNTWTVQTMGSSLDN